jgi:hypothetical protein
MCVPSDECELRGSRSNAKVGLSFPGGIHVWIAEMLAREKRPHTTIVVLGQSSSDTRAGQERAWQVAEGLVFLLPFTLLLAGAPAQILEM